MKMIKIGLIEQKLQPVLSIKTRTTMKELPDLIGRSYYNNPEDVPESELLTRIVMPLISSPPVRFMLTNEDSYKDTGRLLGD